MTGIENNPARITSFFLCDDVRVEQNNKQFYIGVYSESVLFASLSSGVMLRPIILVQSAQAGTFPIWCRFSWPGIDQVTEDGGPVTFTSDIEFGYANYSIVIPLPLLPVTLTEVGEMIMETSFDGVTWSRTSAVRLGVMATDDDVGNTELANRAGDLLPDPAT